MPPSLRILIAEDVELSREIVGALLASYGHMVLVADSGAATLEQLGKQAVDLILMSLRMPVISGLEVTRQIRQIDGPVGRTVIIGMTNGSSPEERQQCLAAGMNDCLTRPITWPQLAVVIDKYAVLCATSRAAEDQLINWDRFNRLAAATSFDRASALLRQAIEDARAACRRIEEISSDPPALTREAHSLRGAVAMLGLAGISAIAGEIERRASAGEPVVGMPEQLMHIIDRTVEAHRLRR